MARKCWRNKAASPAKFKVRQYNRCKLCGRRRGYYRKFGVCRICFRILASIGQIPVVRKASW
ncbi:MAG: type Z 30S ribosomal protein S14 [Proteobacteria bacterium]|nr:type Z 30S ribosomal protein S14 [Pseudomonadota bacterium]